MLTRRYFRLQTLGRLTLTVVDGETESVAEIRPRHLAVLAVIALSTRPISRDALVEMFWGGEDESRARHSLSNALSGLRGVLGAEAITARRDTIALSEDARVEVDTVQFTSAYEAGDDARAVGVYGGRFLHAVHVPDAPEFDDWASRERGKLERRFVEVCERHVSQLQRGKATSGALAAAERWLDAAPTSSAAAAVVAKLNAEQRSSSDATSPAATTPILTPTAIVAESALTQPPTTVPRRRWPVMVGVIAASLAVALVWRVRYVSSEASAATRPIVAVTSIEDVRGDTSIDWLRVALPRMIATDLDGLRGVESVAPSRVRDVVARLTGSGSARLTEDKSMDVARRLRANWSVTGGLSVAPTGYVLDVTVRNVSNVSESETFTILAANPVELGRQAANRVAAILAVGPGGTARYSGVETASADAYRHFTRGMLSLSAEKLGDAATQLDSAIAEDSGFVEAIRAREAVAGALGDESGEHRLALLAARHEDRLPELERLADEIRNADSLGESARADALSSQLVSRFPHDPRAYSARADLLTAHGKVGRNRGRVVARAGARLPRHGRRRRSVHAMRGALASFAGASCRRRTASARRRRHDDGSRCSRTCRRRGETCRRRSPRSESPRSRPRRVITTSRSRRMRWRRWISLERCSRRVATTSSTRCSVRGARRAIPCCSTDDATSASWSPASAAASPNRWRCWPNLPANDGLTLVRADGLARIGRIAEARAIFERVGHPPGTSLSAFTAPQARGFSWSHALEADALVRAGDTASARALVDSIARSGAQSYYGRDKVLHHHVRGVLLFAQGRYADAERELTAAEWSANAWTRTNVELARARLALGHPDSAIAALRDADMAPVDAMARYVPRTEIDWWMSRAFTAAHEPDSAAVYAAYVREAWRYADPSFRARLDSLSRR